MITNKDIRVENGSLILNGDPYPLDGQSPEAIMKIVKDNSDTTPTADSTNPVTSAGIKTYIDNALLPKLSLFESMKTTTGNTLTFTKQLENNEKYLVVMSAGTSPTERRLRLSLIELGNNNINEVYVGGPYTLTVSDRRLTITTENVKYGINASILEL